MRYIILLLCLGYVTIASSQESLRDSIGQQLYEHYAYLELLQLNCDSVTTNMEMKLCAAKDFISQYSLLQSKVEHIQHILEGNDQTSFTQSSNLWTEHRNLECQILSRKYTGGTNEHLSFLICLTTRNEQRIEQLKAIIEELELK